MLKWLRPKSPQKEIVTDDPLATIRVHKAERPLEIYAVSRVNPIFDEGEEETDRSKSRARLPEQPDSPSKSASSGYGSSNRCNSSDCSSGTEDVCEDTTAPRRTQQVSVLRSDVLTVLEQNVGFVKSILVAVGGSGLSPIPEGKVDYCIPRPVWPRREDHSPERQILQELSNTLSQALDGPQSTELVLEGLSSTISRSIERLQRSPQQEQNSHKSTSSDGKSARSDDALRRLSLTLSRSRQLSRMSRALSDVAPSHSSEDAAPGSEEALRTLSLTLSRSRHLTRMTRALRDGTSRSHSSSEEPAPSSSAASSSGFSSVPSSAPVPPVFVHEDLNSASNSTRNAIIYGTLCRSKSAGKSGIGAYEKLLEPSPKTDTEAKSGPWENYLGAGVTAGDVRLKAKTEYFYYPPSQRPDFTLDMPRAERLLRKIREAKQRRFWCRLITSFLGLVFFLLSVMVVSMLLTRGKRIFGPL